MAGGQDMPAGKTRDQWNRIERDMRLIDARIDWLITDNTKKATEITMKDSRIGWLIASNVKKAIEIADLKAARRKDCVAFFRWFWNAPGTNADQGFDQWLKERERP